MESRSVEVLRKKQKELEKSLEIANIATVNAIDLIKDMMLEAHHIRRSSSDMSILRGLEKILELMQTNGNIINRSKVKTRLAGSYVDRYEERSVSDGQKEEPKSTDKRSSRSRS